MIQGKYAISNYALAMTKNILFIEELGADGNYLGKQVALILKKTEQMK